MLKKGKLLMFFGTLLLGLTSFIGFGQLVSAEETGSIVGNEKDEVVISQDLTKEELILELATNSNITKDQAEELLFPSSVRAKRSVEVEESNYAVVKAAWQDRTISDYFGSSRQVYFYCRTTEGGGFRAIKEIVYAGFNAGDKSFKGTLQYALPDPNRIHYTLNGDLHHNGTINASGGISIGVGGSSSMDFSIGGSSSFYQHLFRNLDLYF
ncbi:hypothetical protein [Enterococcus casseliflavus]|uniref:Uncharacterized protein n=1 Tax=Enterococcus casseliflavus TaxID=37734 RepID=A0A6N3G994_ENTCA|nr:hypothetical protein [Enterococcus casseliflavus]EEV31362.1 predicted protein [Enterococcus casseliflavus EC30]EEV37663.1 predicted protein [Enterococcus casseliflavus EC10]MBV6376573.1 hypothetical protein [Enterococcus casseliflavus]MDT2966092.1 hypothetical protein [Enterococcus casseliflavus]